MNRRTSTELRSHRLEPLLATEKPRSTSEDRGMSVVRPSKGAPPGQRRAMNRLYRVFDDRSRLLFC